MEFRNMVESDFSRVKVLNDEVFGWNYLDIEDIENACRKSFSLGLSSSFVIEDGGEIVGCRLTYAPGNWDTESYHPEKWGVPLEKVCYFKTNVIRPDLQGQGLGGQLLKKSIEISKRQGAVAGVADIWLNSPNNSSYRYFSKAGAQVVNIEQDVWIDFHTKKNPCSRCGAPCHCLGAEMILYFEETK